MPSGFNRRTAGNVSNPEESPTTAIALYRTFGFHDIEPYDEYPFPMVFLGRDVR